MKWNGSKKKLNQIQNGSIYARFCNADSHPISEVDATVKPSLATTLQMDNIKPVKAPNDESNETDQIEKSEDAIDSTSPTSTTTKETTTTEATTISTTTAKPSPIFDYRKS